ncbi:MAG: cell wall-binding repeat-containing protein [Actinomycetes bacterium]
MDVPRRHPRRSRAKGVLPLLVAAGLLALGAAPAAQASATPGGGAGPVPGVRTAAATTLRLAGADRYATSAAIATAAFPSGSSTAVLATGTAFPDALSATYLAGVLHAPVLLTDPGQLSSSTAGALARLGVHQVVIVGGTGAVSAAVASALSSDGYSVSRIGGATRYATNVAVIAAGATTAGSVSIGGSSAPTVLLATGNDFPDALSAGAAADALGLPIVLTNPSSPAVPASTLASIAATGARQVLIVGGTAAVPASQQAGLAASGYAVTRVAGADRSATSAALAALAGQWGLSTTNVVLASGTDYPDALGGAVLAGVSRQVLIITDSSSVPGSATPLIANATQVTALGGTTVLPAWLAAGQPAPPAPSPSATSVRQRALADPVTNVAPDSALTGLCWSQPASSTCIQAQLSTLDRAFASEGLNPPTLPSTWSSLTRPQQVFVLANLERVARGLPPVVGMVSGLNSAAQVGANNSTDPVAPATVSGQPVNGWGSDWALTPGGPLSADFFWMYDDGWPSPNIDCTSATSAGCWGHRHVILSFPTVPPGYVLLAGAAETRLTYQGYQALSDTFTIAAVAGNASQFAYTYTWAQAVASGAAG